MKRILCLGLVLTMICAMLMFTPVNAATIVDSGTCGAQGGNIKWSLDSDGTLTISGTGIMASFYKMPWYNSAEKIHKVIITRGVVNVSDSAFSINSTSDFHEYSNLTHISLSDGLEHIGAGAFSGNLPITDIDVPDSVISIGRAAFMHCKKLKMITLGKNITFIGSGAFEDCPELDTLKITENVNEIEGNICQECGKVNYEVSPQNAYFSAQDGVLFNKDKTTLISYAKDKIQSNYIIPSSVKRIGESAFSSCSELFNVSIPNSIASIGEGAFWGTPYYPEHEDGSPIGYHFKDEALYIDNHLIQTDSQPSKSFSVKEGTLTIADRAIGDGIKVLYLPKSIKNIGEYNFSYYDSLTDVYYGGSESEWKEITISKFNDSLPNAMIHYNSTMPSEATPTPKPTPTQNPAPTQKPTPIPTAKPTADPSAPSVEITEVWNGFVKAKVNNCDDNDAQVILAVYNKNGTLIEMQQYYNFGEMTFYSANLQNVNIKVMLWSNTDSIKPLAESVEMSL